MWGGDACRYTAGSPIAARPEVPRAEHLPYPLWEGSKARLKSPGLPTPPP